MLRSLLKRQKQMSQQEVLGILSFLLPCGSTQSIGRLVLALPMAGLLAISAPAQAQISLVHATTCGPGAFPGSVCTIPATGSGNLIVVGWQAGGADTTTVINSVADNAGNAYVEAGAVRSIDTAAGSVADLWYAPNSVAGATAVTITPSINAANGGAVIWEFSGAAAVSPLDQTAVLNSQGSNTVLSGAAVTTTVASGLVLSLAAVSGGAIGISAGNPFTNDSGLNGNGWAHLITSSAGSYSAQWNLSPAGTYASSTVSFRAAGSYSTCDLNQDGAVDILDVQLATDMAMAPANCTAPFGQCNLPFVQAVLSTAMAGTCILPVLAAAPASISFGNVAVGGSSNQVATLTGAGTSSTTISQATVSGAGFSISGPPLPLILPVGQSASFNVTFSPATAGSAGGSIAFVSNALDTPVSQALSGIGIVPAPHSVALSWTPSTSSNVASYNTYRIMSSNQTPPATPYTNMGSVLAAACSPTVCAYTDTGVQAGQGYWYYSTAVDTANNESAPSNIVMAVVPTP